MHTSPGSPAPSYHDCLGGKWRRRLWPKVSSFWR